MRNTLVLGAIVASLGLSFPVSAAPDDPPPQPITNLIVLATAPPSIAEGLTLRVEVAEGAIPDGACVERDEPLANFSSAGLFCADLADGVYSVAVDGAPDDAVTQWECRKNSFSEPVDSMSIEVSESSGLIGCQVIVTRPGVILSTQHATTDEEPMVEALAVYDSSGNDVSTECEVDNRSLSNDEVWCTGLSPGEYEVVALNVPAGERAAVTCLDVTAFVPVASGPTPTSFLIDENDVLWRCNGRSVFPPFVFGFELSSSEGQNLAWLDDLTVHVSDDDGLDVTERCPRTSRVHVERVGDGPYISLSHECRGIDDGLYTVTFDGIPDEYEVMSSCEPVTVKPFSDSTSCAVQVDSSSVTNEEPPAPVPVTELPATGTSNGLIFVAGILVMLAGWLLLLRARAPRTPTR